MSSLNRTINSFVSSNRGFGIEIEAVGLSPRRAAEVLQRAGINIASTSSCDCGCDGCYDGNHCRNEEDCTSALGGNSTRPAWTVKYDGSVDGGFEAVSPILNGQAGLHECVEVARVLVAGGASINRSCGFHVHVDARGLTGPQIINAVKRYSANEAEIDSYIIGRRRGNRCDWCHTMTDPMRELEGLSASRKNNPERVCEAISGRYFKLNLQAYLRHGSLEFRQHSGTLNASKIVNWVIFCIQFIEDSANSVEGAAPSVTENLPSGTQAFLSERRAALNPVPVEPSGAEVFQRLGATLAARDSVLPEVLAGDTEDRG